MENKNSAVVVLLVILIGCIFGIGLLIGINNAVSAGLSPLNSKLTEISTRLKGIEDKLNSGGANAGLSAGIQAQLLQIQNRLSTMGGGAAPSPQQPPSEDYNKIYNIPVGNSSILGNPKAPVTITEFTDLQCPFCGRFYPALKEILAAYPDKVKVVIKNFPLPFHPNARPAAKMTMAANEQGKFQGMMELLLQNGADVSEPKIKEYAQKLGLNYNKLMADYKNQDARWEKQIQEDMQLANSVDVHGTPTFYLNGRKTMARDLAAFKTQIDAILNGK